MEEGAVDALLWRELLSEVVLIVVELPLPLQRISGWGHRLWLETSGGGRGYGGQPPNSWGPLHRGACDRA